MLQMISHLGLLGNVQFLAGGKKRQVLLEFTTRRALHFLSQVGGHLLVVLALHLSPVRPLPHEIQVRPQLARGAK